MPTRALIELRFTNLSLPWFFKASTNVGRSASATPTRVVRCKLQSSDVRDSLLNSLVSWQWTISRDNFHLAMESAINRL